MKNENTYVAIMAGGVGSRFWPSSREHMPKQFLDILGVGKSLLQLTVERFAGLVEIDRILILTNKKYIHLVKEQVPEISSENIIAEPSRNDTAPCNALVALKVHDKNKNANIIVAPSDQIILKEEEFIKKIKEAITFVENNDALLTLGISPTRPDTGYGYIEMEGNKDGVVKVREFKEKPNTEVAQEYINSGNYLWNAGIFIWSTNDILKSFKENEPQITEVLSSNLERLNSADEQNYIDEVYPNTKSISIDYAILEKAKNVYTIPCDIGWSDLGTWNSLHAYLDKDENGNVCLSDNVKMADVDNTIIKTSSDKLVVINGLKDYIVIDEKDALLIYPKSKEQEIKKVKKSIEDKRFL